ncbi:MAG: hypothetical protein R3C09_15040 [Pirellulaceae bacterium]
MQFKTIFNYVVDYKPFVVHKVELIGEMPNRIEITMRSRGNGQAMCSGCGNVARATIDNRSRDDLNSCRYGRFR